MTNDRTAPYAALLLRVTLGVLFLIHAGLKIFVFTPAGAAQFFGTLGLPPALAYVVMTAEVIGGIALILGVWTRYVSLALLPILFGAIAVVHGANGFFAQNTGGGWEFLGLWIVAQVALSMLGDGAYALVPSRTTVGAPALTPARS